MVHPHLEAKGEKSPHAELGEIVLLVLRQHRGRVVPSLIEPGLHGGPVVRHLAVDRLPPRHHHVHVYLHAVKVLLKHHLALEHGSALGQRGSLGHLAHLAIATHVHAVHEVRHLRVSLDQVLQVVHAHHTNGQETLDGFQDSRESNVVCSFLEFILGLDEGVPGRWKTSYGHEPAGLMLVLGSLNCLKWISWEVQQLGHCRGQRDRSLPESHHPISG
mmetsp:Transcript_16238/g.22438  ORF Transcript_16238/g.22438 Transcript_16238/m.22438 type:complete len:217 (-) Transcript_16238:567-1217(-)